jgi:hypothetical protein
MGIFRSGGRTRPTVTPRAAFSSSSAGTRDNTTPTQVLSASNVANLATSTIGGTPADAQIPVGQSGGSYAPKTVSGDASLLDTGALTVTKTNGVAFGPLATDTIDNISIVASSGVISANDAINAGVFGFVSATQVIFSPVRGDLVKIAGKVYAIPSAGITAANTSTYVDGTAGQNLAASTLYYAYLFNNAGTLTIDFSTTGHATDATAGNVGVEIKSGVNSRTLIGVLYTDGSGKFQAATLLLSWFNGRPLITNHSYGNASTTVSGWALISMTPIQALSWAGQLIGVQMWGAGQLGAAANNAVVFGVSTSLTPSSGTILGGQLQAVYTTATPIPFYLIAAVVQTEGLQTFYPAYQCNVGTGTIYGWNIYLAVQTGG